MDKRVFCKRFAIWTAIIVVVVIATLGLLFGKVVEATLAEEIGKWVVMGIFIVGIFEVFAYILAPFFYHMIYDKKKYRYQNTSQQHRTEQHCNKNDDLVHQLRMERCPVIAYAQCCLSVTQRQIPDIARCIFL